MLRTQHGTFDGNSWEDLCQQCFKIRHASDGYQQMFASPGDFGIEGYTRNGLAFQCYCPDEDYEMSQLYVKQRDKITEDLKKLKTYEAQLKERLGGCKIKIWYFVTPIARHNDLLKHATSKKSEVLNWNLSILADDFDIQIRDAEFYLNEIYQLRTINGNKLTYDIDTVKDDFIENDKMDLYNGNIDRKNRKRVRDSNQKRLTKLNNSTLSSLVKGDERLKKMMNVSPAVYIQLVRVINQYETEVNQMCATWSDEAEDLIERIKESLRHLIEKELPNLSVADQGEIVMHMVAKWIALCPLDFED